MNEPGAIEVVSAQVRNATGLPVKLVLQEIDRRELIVELSLSSNGSASPREIAHQVESSSPNLEVLGSWHEREAPAGSPSLRPHELLLHDDASAPAIVRRAFDDLVPTAGWQPKDGSDRAHWLLAVPVLRTDGVMLAALARREGHYRRFSARDAAALRTTLAA